MDSHTTDTLYRATKKIYVMRIIILSFHYSFFFFIDIYISLKDGPITRKDDLINLIVVFYVLFQFSL